MPCYYQKNMNIKSQLESLLFISAKPMTIKQLAELTEKSVKEAEAALEELIIEYKKS